MRYRFIEAEKACFPVRLLCRILHVSRSGYYGWRERPTSAHHQDNRRLEVKIRSLHRASRHTYGSPRIRDALRDAGEVCGKHRVARIMRQAGIRAKTVRKFKATTHSKHSHSVAANLLALRFHRQSD